MQGMTTKLHCCGVTFVKLATLKAMVYLGNSILISHMFFPIGVQFRIGDLHIMLLSVLEFRKSRCKKVVFCPRW